MKVFALAAACATAIASSAGAGFVRAIVVNAGDLGADADSWQVFLVFDDPLDQLLAISGDLDVSSLRFGSATPLIQNNLFEGQQRFDDVPSPSDQGGDTWVVIGDPDTHDTQFSPNFLDGDGQESVIRGRQFEQIDNGGYFDGNPGTAERPDEDLRIMIAQFTLDLAEDELAVFIGTVHYNTDGRPLPDYDSFEELMAGDILVGAPFGVVINGAPGVLGGCCLGAATCFRTTERVCVEGLGGVYLGDHTDCELQRIENEIEEPGGGVFIHVIEVITNCPDPDGASQSCQQGPLIDPWQSPPNAKTCQNFGVEGSPAIPADFFGEGSDPFAGSICLHGVPIGPIDIDEFEGVEFGAADTLIRRHAEPFDRCALPTGKEASVPIEIEALRLLSVAPMVVLFDGGQDAELWDVSVDLSEVHTDEDPDNDPPLGTLTAVKTHCNGGTYTSVMYVSARFTFTKVDDPKEVRVLDTGLEKIPPVMLDASKIPHPWVHDLHEGHNSPSPFCSAFRAGFDEPNPRAECDCNQNQIRDRCDIENAVSRDRNHNRVPDECECIADIDANGTTDQDDIFAVLSAWGPVADDCLPYRPADIDRSCVVDFDDLLLVLDTWGPCS